MWGHGMEGSGTLACAIMQHSAIELLVVAGAQLSKKERVDILWSGIGRGNYNRAQYRAKEHSTTQSRAIQRCTLGQLLVTGRSCGTRLRRSRAVTSELSGTLPSWFWFEWYQASERRRTKQEWVSLHLVPGQRAYRSREEGEREREHIESQPVTPARPGGKQSKAKQSRLAGEQSDITCERAGRGDTGSESEPPELENTTEPQSITKPNRLS